MTEIIKTELFERAMKVYKVSDSDIESFEYDVSLNPEAWPVIRNSGGFRKARVDHKGKGKSGGLRLVYIYIKVNDVIYFLLVYPKNRKENLNQDQLKDLRKTAKILKEDI